MTAHAADPEGLPRPPERPDASLPRPPERPDDAMCCQRGCCPCIFDYYHDALARWRSSVAERGHDPDTVLARFG